MAGDQRVVDDGHGGWHARARYSLARDGCAPPQRRAQGARPRPRRARWSARSPPGARDQGVLVQRDTYFRAPRGRLKLREEEPGGRAPDRLRAARRGRRARRRPTGRAGRRAGAAARRAWRRRSASTSVVEKRRRLLLWETRADPPRRGRRAWAASSSSRRSPTPDSDLAREREQVAPAARGARTIDATPALRGAAPTPTRLARRRRADARARPGAARARARGGRRAPTRRTRTSPSAPRCARPTAAATPAPTSRTPPTRRASARRRRRSARWWPAAAGAVAEVVVAAPSAELCTPCGGCRQRLREFAAPDAPIHLADLERVRRTTTLAELLPLSFGPENLGVTPRRARPPRRSGRAPGLRAARWGSCSAPGLGELADALADRVEIPYAELPGFRAGTVAGHAGTLVARPLDGMPVAVFARPLARLRGDRRRPAIATPIRTLKLLGAEALVLTNAAGSLRAEAGPGSLVAHLRPHQHARLQPAHRAQRRRRRPALPEPRATPTTRRCAPRLHAPPTRSARPLHDGVYLAVAGPELRDARRDPRVPDARRRPRRDVARSPR